MGGGSESHLIFAFFTSPEGGEAVRRAREKAHLQSNDYYSSDEDTFLDRTGQIEARRRRRMRRMGVDEVAGAKPNDSSDSADHEEPSDSLSIVRGLLKPPLSPLANALSRLFFFILSWPLLRS